MNRLWILFFLLFLTSPVRAEEKIKLEEVVITATRYEERLTDIPASVSLISEEDIQNSTARNIPDLLKTEAGIHINDITGNQRSFTVDLRGFGETSSSNTLVLVDGRRVNQADLSGVDWTEIPLERVSRIEIIRGGRGSVLYGDNATGGVINIITKEGTAGFKAGIDMAAGSFGTFKAGAYASGESKNLSLHLSGNYLTADGYRENSNTESKDLGLNAAYYLKDSIKIDFSSGYHKDRTGLPGALKESDFAAGFSRTSSKFPDDFSEVEDYYLKLAPEVYFSGDNVFRLDTSFRQRDFLSFSSGDWGNFLGDSEIRTIALSPQVILKNSFDKIRNNLTAGLDYQKTDNNILNDSLFFGSQSIGIFSLKKENYGYYVHDEMNVTESLRFSGGFRHDKAKFSFSPSSPDSVSMSKNVYTAGVNYTFLKKSYVYLNYSRSFRYPLLDELYSFFTNTINTGLVPQESDDYEAGIRHYFNDDIAGQINVFRLDSDKEIFFNPAAYSNENLDGMTRRDGVEVSFDADAAGWLSLKGSYTYLSARIKEGVFKEKNVPNVPRHKATIDMISHIGKDATLTLSGVYIGERPFISDFSNDFSKQESYFLLNAKFAYRWKALKAFVNINNLTNKAYSEYGVIGGFPLEKAFYPSQKRNFLFGLSLAF
ncbi:MAG: TonB-dependent receptor [Nitrospirae bacterium]|nr:TonB-dependent receptor [Nitrospirota bacterium]